MGAKHTPGPWHYDAEARRDRGYIRTEFGRETGGAGIAVARLACRSEFGPSQYDANGRLIAAAPDLAEALRDLLPHVACEPEPTGAITRALAALEKAGVL